MAWQSPLTERAEASGDPGIVETLARVDPSTIHRLVGWSWGRGRFARNQSNRLPHDLVIVDEMSMVSLPLASRLLSAVRDDATVVLVGDPFQLESIEAGTVLADIVGEPGAASESPMAERVVVLDRMYRFAEDDAIGEFADAVRQGDTDTAVRLLAGGGDRLSWVTDRTDRRFDELWSTVVTQRSRLVELARDGSAVARHSRRWARWRWCAPGDGVRPGWASGAGTRRAPSTSVSPVCVGARSGTRASR